ncbi:RNA polymerase II transcription mediator complex subunit 9-domain-containing protein [Neurospora hispaniola]|uniref:Mediator of RNA polymerase II transcription subunit 9 n=1 Tax=Neurospora hispaniola TaxID=588809 RepID=A0AAJ0MMS4_9PEZI|nr:RNA polymerase II transcription mediator complex subunit 9-domain-containing protein [Neurospora hispaniola]
MATHIPPTLSPDAIDTLTELTLILTKFRAAQASARSAGAVGPSSSSTNPSHGPNSSNNAPISTPAPGAVTGTTPLPIPTTSNPNATTAGSFSAKDLPQATDNLKHKLQRARQAVLTLPDIGRTITQQEKEIAELEERKRKQVAMLAKIRDEGLQFARLEQSRRDEEGERMMVE